MLNRLLIQLALIFVFALTQIGLTTHEISHFSAPEKHSQPDKNTSAESCEQCVAYSQVAGGLPSQPFVLPSIAIVFQVALPYFFNVLTTHHAAYVARAPPQIFSL